MCYDVSIRQNGFVTESFDDKKIDLVAVSPDGLIVALYIVQSEEWTGSDAQVASLQAKIHNYVGFALDGQMVRLYPSTAGLPWEIVISCLAGLPDPRTANVLNQLAGGLSKYGGALRVQEHTTP